MYCRIVEMILLSIYPTDYSIANLHTFIQIFLIFCTKIKHPGCFFSWALPTPGLWNKDGGFWLYYRCRRDKDGDSGIPFQGALPQTFLSIDTGSAALHRELSAGSVPAPSFDISGSTSSPHSDWPNRASFPVSYHLGTRFLSWWLSYTGGLIVNGR